MDGSTKNGSSTRCCFRLRALARTSSSRISQRITRDGMAERPEIGVVILAGGGATRLPNKLELAAGGIPMLVRVYRNVSPGRKTYVSCAGGFSPEVDSMLDCPMVVDRWPGRGPLGGLV